MLHRRVARAPKTCATAPSRSRYPSSFRIEGNDRMSAALQLASGMSDAEWHARCELAAVYHVCLDLGWTDLINTHMSARVPGEPNHFLINNYGETFDEITASSLVKMDMDGNVLSPGGKFNNVGFIIHSGVYKARPDAN